MDLVKIKKELNKLNIPKNFFKFPLDAWYTHDFTMILSIRKDAGKTTSALLVGAVLFKLYGYTTEYIRSDESQITRANVETLYDVVVHYGYIQKLFPEYNDIIYKPMLKKFFLCFRDENGDIIKEHPDPICCCHSIELYKKAKSSYNNPKGKFLVFDEFCDTDRETSRQIIELSNSISTIGLRGDESDCRVVMLGNNTNKYLFWFDEFGISDDITNLDFGGCIDKQTFLGTTIYVTLLDKSDLIKENIKNRKIRFFGFNNPKMNAFNGLEAFQGELWKHLPDTEWIETEYLVLDRLFIRHRNRYIQVRVYYEEERGYYCFLNWFGTPKLKDNIILTEEPIGPGEIYGWGQFTSSKVKSKLFQILALRTQNKWFYENNTIGDLVNDFVKQVS